MPPSAALSDRPAERPPLIRLEGVSKSFSGPEGEVAALRDVGLVVRRGDIVGIAGAAGAGKSTLRACRAARCAPRARPSAWCSTRRTC
jgi:ABC-type sugar transport system ATPase subunit